MKLLVVAPNWLGDALMALPAIQDTRRHDPSAWITVAARRHLVDLAAMMPGVDAAVPLDAQGGLRALARMGADADRLRELRFDAALLLPNSFHAALLVRRAGIPERWGYRGDLRSPLLTRAVARPPAARRHQAEYYQHLTRALGMPAGPLVAAIPVGAPQRDAADRLLEARGWTGGPLVGLAPGAAYGRAKRWPPERMGALAARLAAEAGARVVTVGAVADREAVDLVVRTAAAAGAPAGAVIDVAGDTDLPALAGILSRCAAFVSNDSGAMHLAAAVGVPVVAIFGPTREWATAPLPGPGHVETAIVHTDVWCRPCMLRTCPIDHRCMTGIGVGDVLAPVRAALARPPVDGGTR